VPAGAVRLKVPSGLALSEVTRVLPAPYRLTVTGLPASTCPLRVPLGNRVGVGDSTGVKEVAVAVSTGAEEVGVAVSTGVGVAVSTGGEEVDFAVPRQFSVPESVNVFPASGTNCQS